MGGGQMVAADFVMTPSVVFSENNAGGVGGAVGGLLGGKGCSGRRRAEVQGSADQHAGGRLAERRPGGCGRRQHEEGGPAARRRVSSAAAAARSAGGYGNTNEGKIIAAAFMDNYNKVVGVVRGDPSLQRNVGTLKQEAAAGGAQGRRGFNEGDVLGPKIANVKLMASHPTLRKSWRRSARGDELVVVGGEKDGFVNVQGSTASGWVKVVLVNKR